MSETITKNDVARMIACAASQIRQHHALLSELDSVSGDGDHGSAMLRSVDRLEKAFGALRSTDIKSCFHQAGWDVMDADSGASGAILGSFFLGMADGLTAGASSLNCTALAAAFESGLQAVCNQTKAHVGDKTLVDALVPAIEALCQAAHAGQDSHQAMQAAASAAKRGADSTANLTAHFGRARYLGERTQGHRDPGAVSVALLFEGFSRGLDRPTQGASNGRH
jgi:dihydroxyacetone kinase-like protein